MRDRRSGRRTAQGRGRYSMGLGSKPRILVNTLGNPTSLPGAKTAWRSDSKARPSRHLSCAYVECRSSREGARCKSWYPSPGSKRKPGSAGCLRSAPNKREAPRPNVRRVESGTADWQSPLDCDVSQWLYRNRLPLPLPSQWMSAGRLSCTNLGDPPDGLKFADAGLGGEA